MADPLLSSGASALSVSNPQPVIPPTKPGYKTTEFWLALVATLVTALYASGVIGAGGSLDKGLAFIAAALGALGYSVSRGLTKAS